jgi:hypothetical protein
MKKFELTVQDITADNKVGGHEMMWQGTAEEVSERLMEHIVRVAEERWDENPDGVRPAFDVTIATYDTTIG